MAQDITVKLENRPGTLADLGETLGRAGINIDGGCGFPCQGRGTIHILVKDGSGARKVLADAGFDVGDERQVLLVDVEDRPGEAGEITRQLANAGVNIDLLYISVKRQMVLGVDDLEKAKAALSSS